MSASKKSETDESILALLGLSLEEFARIVLLPQGEFAQFLRLNSKDRKDVLLKLFPMEQYTRLIEEVRERSRDAGVRLREKESLLESLRKDRTDETGAADREALLGAIADGEKKHAALLDAYQTQSRICEQARAVSQKQVRFRELEEMLETFANEKESIAKKEDERVLARKAAPLVYRVEQLSAAQADYDALMQELSTAQEELSAALKAKAAFEQGTVDHANDDEKRQELRARRGSLAIAVDIAKTLVKEQEEVAELKKRQTVLHEEAEIAIKRLKEFDARLDELSEPVAQLEERDRIKEERDVRLQRARVLHEFAADYERLNLARSAHAGAAANTEKKIAEADNDLAIARAELAELEQEAERVKSEHAATELAKTLKTGQPCPVCGATDHPKPAVQTTAFDTGERMAAKKRTIQSLESSLEKLRNDCATQRANEQAAAERLAEIVKKAQAAPDQTHTGEIPSPGEAEKALEQAAKDMEVAVNALNQSRRAVREAEEIRINRTAFLASTEQTTAERESISRSMTQKEAGIRFNMSRYREAFPDESIPDPALAEESLEILDATLLELDAQIKKFAEGFAAAKEQCVSLTTRKDHLAELLERKKEELGELQRELAARCAQAGFADSAAIRQAARSEEQLDELDRYILAWNKRFTETAAEAERLEGELREWTGADAKTAEAELERITGELKSSESSLHETKLALSNLDAREQHYQTMVAEFEELSRETGSLVALAGDLTGQNPAKMSFDAWILGSYLEEITAYANTRLERMSDGRYRIQVDDQYRRGNSLAGLDLEILDAYTGKTRPAATLSGGETFMASISLALGLADSIQARSGGIQLDAVFIDEGFGSLDETSLEKALGILDEIRGHRMVGLISHVPELRSRIPGRIEIVKTQTGSRIVQGEIS